MQEEVLIAYLWHCPNVLSQEYSSCLPLYPQVLGLCIELVLEINPLRLLQNKQLHLTENLVSYISNETLVVV